MNHIDLWISLFPNASVQRGLSNRLVCLVLFSFCAVATCLQAAQPLWVVEANPYRLRLKLGHSISGPTVIDIDSQAIIDRIAEVAVDQVNDDTFAYEKAVLVNPDTGKIIGGFQLVREKQPFEIDGSFQGLQDGNSPWSGFLPDRMTFETVQLGNAFRHALMITEKSVRNAKVQQTVKLTPGESYLLEYWIMMDPKDNEMGVMLYDPELELFAQIPHSYFNKMPPQGKWAERKVLFRPKTSNAELSVRPIPSDAFLQVSHAFTGQGGVADIRLQPVSWNLIVDPDVPVDELDLYVIARAGHRLAVPKEDMIVTEAPKHAVEAELGAPEVQSLNPGGVTVASNHVTAWTIDPVLPLKVGNIRKYRPLDSQTTQQASVTASHGGSASLVIAVDADRPRLDELSVSADLPADVTFHRLASIPVYDGPTVNGILKGNLIETRYDAMVPVDFSLDPDSADGIHLIVATIIPRDETLPGLHYGKIGLSFQDTKLEIPLKLTVLPQVVAPKRHFGTLFGGLHYTVRYTEADPGFTAENIPVAEFHGIPCKELNPTSVTGLTVPDSPSSLTENVRELAERYYRVMLDNHLLPESPALYAYFTYDVEDQGKGLAPKLTNWEFSKGFDKALEEFVIGRDMPWLTVARSNGHLMNKLRLGNGVTYSVHDNPKDPNWVKLSREQFNQLIGDYWNAFGQHLSDMGLLDRAIFVIDESGPETYEDIYAYVMAMRSRPFAKQIKIGHTTYKTSTWNCRLENGALLMDEVLDVPMPENDDHFNFLEPEWYARFKRPGKESWVYHVETDHMTLQDAGLSTVFLPLKLQHFGVTGWYCWASFIWSMPYAYLEGEKGGFKYGTGPVINPWVNPFYHHGPGVLSFFYPPDPRGPAPEPTYQVIPSYRLTLMRDGIQDRALLEVLESGLDDAGNNLQVDQVRLKEIQSHLEALWADNPVQWYLSYYEYRAARQLLYDLASKSLKQ